MTPERLHELKATLERVGTLSTNSDNELLDEVAKLLPSSITNYQVRAWKTALPAAQNVAYMALGLAGEAGEVANKVKKVIRDQNGQMTEAAREAIADEIGDVLWYAAGLATVINLDLTDIALDNLLKLAARADANKLQGSGDKR